MRAGTSMTILTRFWVGDEIFVKWLTRQLGTEVSDEDLLRDTARN